MTDDQRSPEAVVRELFASVRSGREPDRAADLMAPFVRAHQVQAEAPVSVERTPAQYADHVREMVDALGAFTIELDELLVDRDRVFVRWTQRGRIVRAREGQRRPGPRRAGHQLCLPGGARAHRRVLDPDRSRRPGGPAPVHSMT